MVYNLSSQNFPFKTWMFYIQENMVITSAVPAQLNPITFPQSTFQPSQI
jgi:hypothetical protein